MGAREARVRVPKRRALTPSAAWAHSKPRATSAATRRTTARRRSRRRYTTQQLTMLTWAHGMLAHEDEGLLRACVKEIRDRLGEFNTRDVTNAARALDALGVRASDKLKLVERPGRAARSEPRRVQLAGTPQVSGRVRTPGGRMPTATPCAQRTLAVIVPGDERRRRALVQDTDELSRHGKIARGRQLRGPRPREYGRDAVGGVVRARGVAVAEGGNRVPFSEDAADATDGAGRGRRGKGRWRRVGRGASARRARRGETRGGDGGDGRCGETRRETPRESPAKSAKDASTRETPNPSRRRPNRPC